MKKKLFPLVTCLFLIMIFSSCCTLKNGVKIMDIGICTTYTNGEIMKNAGYSYVEEGVSGFLVPTKNNDEFEKILAKTTNCPLPIAICNGFIPADLKCVGPNVEQLQILNYMEIVFKRAKKAGVEMIVFGSGGSRSIPEGFSRDIARQQFVDLCKKMAPIAKKYNVTVVLEPLNSQECNFINSVAEGGEIVKEVNHRNFRLLADFYHMKMDNESPNNIIKYGGLIKHIHIAEKEKRSVPGMYNEDFRPYFEALKKINYAGKISIEARWIDFNAQAPIAIKIINNQVNK
ncbi:MAG: sugar phosphate isomerase/epimerase [Fermentimonas sp.]|nr:sugar phosphate isomerase/epimerase [Fermentimonas sp.]